MVSDNRRIKQEDEVAGTHSAAQNQEQAFSGRATYGERGREGCQHPFWVERSESQG